MNIRYVQFILGNVQTKVVGMEMTFDGQRSSYKSEEGCAKEEVSSSLLGKLALSCLRYKRNY